MLKKLKSAYSTLLSIFMNLHHGIAKSQQRRADYFILNHMTDAELRDIGISRGEIKERFYSKG